MEKPVLSPRFKRDLAENNPIGMPLTEIDVQAWFDLVWMKFSSYGYKGRGVKRAIIHWWSRVEEYEIEKARARALRVADEAEVARLEAQVALDMEQPENVVRVDFASRLTG